MSKTDILNALDPHASAWVGANAGAGKTYILVSRLARLMLDGVAPERILCLTYTRAAAAEMQDRLFELLGQWALLDDDALRAEIETRLGCKADADMLYRARILFARALETPGGLRVQTIHGFCESLLKRFPLEAGLSPHFDLLDEQDARALQADLIADILNPDSASNSIGRDEAAATTELQAAMARLTRALAEPDILALGRQIIDRRAAFEKMPMATRLADLAKAMGLFDKTTKTASENPTAALPDTESLLEAFYAAHKNLIDQLIKWLAGGTKTDAAQAARLAAWRSTKTQKRQAGWADLHSVFFTGSGDRRARLATKGLSEKNPDLWQRFEQLADTAETLDGQVKALANYHLTEAVYLFAAALLSAYQNAKTRRAVLDYEDMIAVTNRLLSGPQAAQWVLYKIDNGLHHILIDEAQDTSPAQWQIISSLAEAFFDDAGLGAAAVSGENIVRTIFAVGDEKQSIFSFQGADPKGFDAQRAYFEQAVHAIDGRFYDLPMLMSRRSAPEILRAVDLVFADRAAGVSAKGTPLSHEAFRTDAVGHVEIWPPSESDATPEAEQAWQIPDGMAIGGRHRLAEKIAAKISALLGDETQDVRAGDILVLVRTRDEFVHALTRALKRKNIAIAGSDRMVLLEQIAVADLLAAMDFALNADDDMALAIFLRSPLGGLSEEQLFKLAHGRKASLWKALESVAHENEFKAAYERLGWLRGRIDFLSPYEILAQFLGALGAHKLLSARLGPEIDDPLSELLRLALSYEARQAASMQGFLHWLRQGSQEIKRDMEAGGGAVRIMTVHGAKGLEAPIVFLPDTCRPAKKRGGGSDRVQFNAERTPLWRANQALRDPYNAAQAEAAEQAAAEEEKRLLYVAMTRARERLYIAGWLGAKEKAPPTDSWYAMIEAGLDETARAALAAGEGKLPRPVTDEISSPKKSDIDTDINADKSPPAWLHAKPTQRGHGTPHIGYKIFSPSGLSRDEAPEAAQETGTALSPDAEAARQLAAMRGHAIHALLQFLPALPTDARAARAKAYLEKAYGEMLDAEKIEAAIAEALSVMASDDLAEVFSAAARAEAPIAGQLLLPDGQSISLSGQIDRMVETDEMVLLVDFKTGTPPTKGAVLPTYVTQMAAYRGLVEAAMGNEKPVHCALVWTQNGHIERLSPADMADALAALAQSFAGDKLS